MNKKIIIVILVTVVIISGFLWLKYRDTEREVERNLNLTTIYSLESSDADAIKKNTLLFVEKGKSEIIVDDITALPGYPQDDNAKYGLKIIAGSNNKLLFKGLAFMEGVYYSPVYILNTLNIDNGFEKVEDFIVGGVNDEGYVNQDGSKIIGLMSYEESESYTAEIMEVIVDTLLPEEDENKGDLADNAMYYQYDELFVLDIRRGTVPKNFYESYAGQTFFFPSFYGDDDMHIRWKSNNELEIKEYATDEIYRNIDPNFPEHFPEHLRTRTIRF